MYVNRVSSNILAVLGGAALAVASAAHAQEHIATNDGLALQLSPDGKVSRVTVDGKLLPGGKTPGGFFIADVEQTLAEQPHLLLNPSGEADEDGDTKPDAWTLGGDWAWDEQVAHTGKRSFRVTLPQTAEPRASGALTYPRMRVEPSTNYTLRYWVRTQDCGGKYPPCAYVWQVDAEGKQSAPQVDAPARPGTNDWFEVKCHFQTAPQTRFVDPYANIYYSYGTAWFDDFSLTRAEVDLQPVPMQIQPAKVGRHPLRLPIADCRLPIAQTPVNRKSQIANRKSENPLAARALPEKLDVWLNATYRQEPGRLRLDVQLEDLRKADRRLMVRFALPINADGWTWWDHIAQSRKIQNPDRYEHTCRIDMGEGRLTIYPFNSLNGPDAAITLGVPLDQGPRIWVAQYDGRVEQFMATFYLGLSPETAKFPGQASFSLVIYRHDPQWGMRAAAKRFYDFYPEHFVKRSPYEAYLNYVGLEEQAPDGKLILRGSGGPKPADLEDGTDFGEAIPNAVGMNFCYRSYFSLTNDPKQPTDDQVRAFLEARANEVGDHPPDGFNAPGHMLKQITHDEEGQIRFHQCTWKLPGETYGSKTGTGWFMEFRVNEDPEVSPWLRDWFMREWTAWSKAHPDFKPFHAAMSSDEICGYTGDGNAPDFRREHLKYADVPLSYGPGKLTLGVVNLAYDWLKTFLWPHSEENKYLVTGNANQFNRAFEFPYVDLGMVEFEWNSSDLLQMPVYIRSLSYHKLYRYWRVCGRGEEDPASVVSHLHRCLMWATYPAVWGVEVVAHNLNDYRHLYRRYVPIIEELSASGWEPITHATVGKPGVLLERYGSFAAGNLHFAVQNMNKEPVETTVTVDTQAEGIQSPADVRAYDLTHRQALPLQKAPALTVALALQPDETRVFQLADVRGCYREACRQAQRGLGRLQRVLKAEVSRAPALDLRAPDAAAMARSLRAFDTYLESLRSETPTPNDIHRDKMFYRIADEVSLAALALLDLEVKMPNWPETQTGKELTLPISIRNGGETPLSVAGVTAVSPFSSEAVKVEVLNPPHVVAAGEAKEATLRIWVGDTAGRGVVPVLVSVTGRRGHVEATARRLLDVQITP